MPNKATTLLDRTFDEGIALTMEVRNYIAYHEQADRREYDLPRCLQVGYQHTRVSARLISGDDMAFGNESFARR